MLRPILKLLDRLELFASTGKRLDKFFSPSAAAGTRIVPGRGTRDDPFIGGRIDHGEITDRDGQKVRQIKVQPNKGADDPSLKDMAAKDPHQVVAEAYLPLYPTDRKEALKKAFMDLRDDARRKDAENEAKKQPPKKGGKK